MGNPSLAVIPFTLVRKKGARGVAIAVKRDGTCRVTTSQSMSLRDIQHFVEQKAEWIQQARAAMYAAPPSVMDLGSKQDYARHKYGALKVVLERIAFWNARYCFSYRTVQIRDMRSRWGSCSKDGKLCFTYRLALLPVDLVDYVVVHELCHLAVFNHSPAFWKRVAEALPHYRELRQRLKCS